MFSKEKPKVIVILGPTASGKSDVAIKLAKKIYPVKSPNCWGARQSEQFDGVNGEIISADSRQIFKGLNIGTGKVPGTWNVERGAFISEGIPHHLIDIINPMEDYNVSDFKRDAEKIIEDILSRKKLPIICGGSNFWISAVVEDMAFPEVKPNLGLRKKLEKENVEDLFKQLQKIDPERAADIDPKNKVRLIRALEIAGTLGKVPQLCHPEFISGSRISPGEMPKQFRNDKYEFLQIGIDVPREILNEKIKLRLEQRFKDGMIEEVENLHKNGVSWEWMEKIGLEYRWISRYLQNKISLEEMKEKLYFDIIHYAKRQMTWLRKNKNIIWLNDYKETGRIVSTLLKKS